MQMRELLCFRADQLLVEMPIPAHTTDAYTITSCQTEFQAHAVYLPRTLKPMAHSCNMQYNKSNSIGSKTYMIMHVSTKDGRQSAELGPLQTCINIVLTYLENIFSQCQCCIQVQHPAQEDLDSNHEGGSQ